MTRLRIATRASALAVAQSGWVADRLRTAHPGLDVELVEVTTTGDADRTSPVTTLTEVGAFVRAVQQAVLDGRADLAVHSCKDLPVAGPEGLAMIHPRREAPWDVLCGARLDDLDRGARVGTGSPRRTAQLRLLRPDLDVVPIRGNVDTRVEKARSGVVDAVVLAEAGLARLGRSSDIDERFDLDRMVPAPAQAALAVEAPEGSEAATLAAAIDHGPTRAAVEAERALLALTGAGCRAALGALAVVDGGSITMTGFVDDGDGPRRAVVHAPSPSVAAVRLQEALGL